MKKQSLKFYSAIFFCIFAACNGNNNAGGNEPEQDTTTMSAQPAVQEWETSCYAYYKAKDTVYLSLKRKGDEVEGELNYNWYEKDSNHGSLKGRIENNLVITWYTFQAEGMTSVREEIFKMDGDQLTLATGDVDFRGDTAVFKSHDQLNFSGITLNKVPCN
jgi:hypothetical protein